MDKQVLGEFLRSRRERLRPTDVGLSEGPRRRTPGLRREEVAVLAHISTEYYVRLEQGRAPRPSSEVLAAIAAALRLTDAENEHLHVLSGAARRNRDLHVRTVRPSIRSMLDRMPHTAGMVLSAAFEVLAWNDLLAALLEDFTSRTAEERNLARLAFLGGVRAESALYGASDPTEFRRGVARSLRSTLARYPQDPVILRLVDDLRTGSAEFARLWSDRDVASAEMLTKTFRNPRVGFVTVDCDTLALVEEDQQVVLYTAPAGSSDADKLALLAVLGPATAGML